MMRVLPVSLLPLCLAVVSSIVYGASYSSAKALKNSSRSSEEPFVRVTTGNADADAKLYKAFAYRRSGELEKAEKLIRETLKKYPAMPELHRQLSFTLVMEKKTPEMNPS